MDIKQFKNFCKKEFELRGFKKIQKTFYLAGKDLLCGIELQKSDYSNSYYINYYFFLGKFDDTSDYPVCYELDVQGRIVAMSKTQTVMGKQFLTSAIEYEEYTEEELLAVSDDLIEEARKQRG